MKKYHKKPYGKATGYKKTGEWHWQCVSWVKCHCGLWHSNRFIPPDFWEQKWEKPTSNNRKKVGVILIKNKKKYGLHKVTINAMDFLKERKNLTNP